MSPSLGSRLAGRATRPIPFLAALLGAGLLHAPTLAAQHRATVRWAAGSPSSNGYDSAAMDVQYSFLSCDGDLWITMGGMPRTIQISATYWYKGSRYPVPASARNDWTLMEVAFGGDVVQRTPQGMRRVASFSYKTGPSYSGGCFSAINFTSIGKMATLFAPKLTSDERSAILASLSVDARDVGTPLTSQAVEWASDTHIRDSVYAVKQAERERLRLARNDSIAKARAAAQAATQAAAAARRDSAATRTASSTRPRGTTPAASAGTTAGTTAGARTAASSGRQASTAPATAPAAAPVPTQAERNARAQQQADSIQRALAEQQAQRQAEEAATAQAVSGALMTTATMAQDMGAMFGGYYLTGEEPPANSSYTIQTMSGIGAGISGRWAYIDGGLISMTLTDDYIAKQKARNSYAPDKDQSGYFVSGGLSLEMPFEEDSKFGFAPSLGYTYITGGTEVTRGGVHLGAGVRIGGFKVRVDMGSGEYGSTYGIGGYIRF